jgi:ATP/maltotriose-dependent transcriptional regulator MalT
MNRLDLMDVALKQSTFYADSCSIIKYDIYAHEELLAIYEKRNDLTKIVATRRKLDTLNSTYATQVNLTALHEQKESILLGDKDQKLKDALKSQTTITILLVGLLILTIALVGWLVVFRRQKRQAEHDIARMKAELESYLANRTEVIAPKQDTDRKLLYELSDRQQEVLDCMAAGMSNKEIADKLYISTNTVKYHIKNIYQLLEIKDRKDFLVNIKK